MILKHLKNAKKYEKLIEIFDRDVPRVDNAGGQIYGLFMSALAATNNKERSLPLFRIV